MTRGWGQGGDSFRGATSVWGDARFLEMAVGDGCSRCFVPLKIVKKVNFMLCTLHPNSRKKTQEKNLPLQVTAWPPLVRSGESGWACQWTTGARLRVEDASELGPHFCPVGLAPPDRDNED